MRLQKRVFAILLVVVLANLTILLPVLPVSAASVPVTLSPVSGPPGSQVIASGTAFTPGNLYSVTFTLKFVPTVVATGTVPAGGSVGAVFLVPILPRGQYSVTITTSTDTTKTPAPTFTITPQIFLSAASGVAGDRINVSGNGFNATQSISIYFDNQDVAVTTSDSQGTFSNIAVTIPPTASGSHTMLAKDLSGSSPNVTFSIGSKIILSATEGTVGSTIKVSGNGFTAYQTIAFLIDNLSLGKTTIADASGKFNNFSLIIPTISGGNHTIKAQDPQNIPFNPATTSFSVIPSITIQPNNGPVGTKVTITGKGFAAMSNNPIVITYNGVVVATSPASLSADGYGNFFATFTIPSGTGNTGTVTASDSFDTLSTSFSTVATITVNPLSGPVGTIITATGIGFKENTAINISYDNTEAGTATTDADGKFTTTFPVLASITGTHQITITDQVSILKSAFDVIPEVKINPTSDSVGQDININGTGFFASSDITVNYDTDQIAKTTTDTNGTFTVGFKAPTSKSGDHQIIVTDSTNTITSDFSIASISVPPPSLLLPHSLTKASKTPTLDWQNVNDPNGVTYSLQISKDATFGILVLQKDGLKTPEYKLTAQETLDSVSKDMPYYWRVKAVDGALNESKWSSPFTFYVGTVVPTRVYYVGVVGLVLIVGVIAYWLERRRVK